LKCFSALRCRRTLWVADKMEITRNGLETMAGPGDWLAGNVYILSGSKARG
jgi:hypothetical protein